MMLAQQGRLIANPADDKRGARSVIAAQPAGR